MVLAKIKNTTSVAAMPKKATPKPVKKAAAKAAPKKTIKAAAPVTPAKPAKATKAAKPVKSTKAAAPVKAAPAKAAPAKAPAKAKTPAKAVKPAKAAPAKAAPAKAKAPAKANKTGPVKGRGRVTSASGPLSNAVVAVLKRARRPLSCAEITDALLKKNYQFTHPEPKRIVSIRIYKLKGVQQTGPGRFTAAE
jgi:adenylate kinase